MAETWASVAPRPNLSLNGGTDVRQDLPLAAQPLSRLARVVGKESMTWSKDIGFERFGGFQRSHPVARIGIG